MEIEAIARAAGVFADEAGFVGLVDRRLQTLPLVEELAPDINVTGVNPHSDRGEQTALDQLLRVIAKDVAVLAGPRLTFIGIDAEIGRMVALFRHERPFQPGREAGAAAAAQPGFLNLLDDPVASLEDQLFGPVPIAASPRTHEPPIVEAIEVGENAILVGEHSLPLIPTPRRASSGW